PAWDRALRVARRRRAAHRRAPRRLELRGPDEPRRRGGPRRDPRPQRLLQRLLRGSDGLGPARARRARAGRSEEGDRMIEAWRRVLVLAPHTDDGEFGCGGTMARLVDGGAEVRYVA